MLKQGLKFICKKYFCQPQSDPGPGSYSPQGLTRPEASLRPPFGSSADRFDRHARRFFLGSTVGYAYTPCITIMQRNALYWIVR